MKPELISPTINIAVLVVLFITVAVVLTLMVDKHIDKRFDFEDDE